MRLLAPLAAAISPIAALLTFTNVFVGLGDQRRTKRSYRQLSLFKRSLRRLRVCAARKIVVYARAANVTRQIYYVIRSYRSPISRTAETGVESYIGLVIERISIELWTKYALHVSILLGSINREVHKHVSFPEINKCQREDSGIKYILFWSREYISC